MEPIRRDVSSKMLTLTVPICLMESQPPVYWDMSPSQKATISSMSVVRSSFEDN